MKYRILSLLVVAGMLLGSCVVDEIPSEGGTILAEIENDDTRSAVTDDGTFTWSAGDQIWLQTTIGSVVGTLSSGAGTSSANFSYGGFVGEMNGNAVCPYNDGHSISGDILNFALPASYNLGSSLTNTNAAMYGVNVGESIKFNHLAGVMRFKFKDVPARVNKFTITLDKKINGTFEADLTADYPVIETSATSTASEKTITLNFNALTAKSDISVYVPLPIGTYNSLELGLYDDGQSVWTYSNSVTNTVNRKSLILMPVVSLDGSDEDLEVQPSDYIDEYGENHGPGIKIGETIWAPVNCGYHKTDYPYGKLYQWGRKYGQGYNENDATVPTIEEGPISMIIGSQKSKSNVFFTSASEYDYDWLYPQNGTLWNLGTESKPVKTEYDPCPDGWRVPTYAELNELCHNYSSWTSEDDHNGRWFSGTNPYSGLHPQVFFPAAGGRFAGGLSGHRGNLGSYWSSSPENHLGLDDGVAYMSIFNRGIGYSVRCVQDDNELISVSSLTLSAASISMRVNEAYILSAIISPSSANQQSAHWWSDDENIATVDQNGTVITVATGTTTITAMAGMQTATCEVTVTESDVSNQKDYIDEYGENHGPGIKIGETAWAPVNCGYHKTDYPWGKLYQWGRRYGQGYDENDAVVPTIEEGTVDVVTGNHTSKSNVFFISSEECLFDWVAPQDGTLWNLGTESKPVKTEYDPCPDGWRVPTYAELNELCQDCFFWTSKDGQKGYWFRGVRTDTEAVPQVFLPAAGYHYYGDGLAHSRGYFGRYWSSRPHYNYAYFLDFYKNFADMASTYRADGYSVRCVQE